MSNPPAWKNVQAVLQMFAPPDLMARYHVGMETYVAVRQSTGEPVYESPSKLIPGTFNDGCFRYYHFRIQEPSDLNKVLSYPLCKYWDAIGISGWDIQENVAYGVPYDFDSLINHDAGIGLPADILARVLEALQQLPYVEIRRSTSGNGYHVWVWFPLDCLPKIENRPQMKALARAVLQRMSFDTGYDFNSDVDHLGDIFWIAARRATPENGGLTLIKAAEHALADWPRDFLDHVEVVTRKRRRTRLRGTGESDTIEQSYQDRPRVRLEKAHRAFITAHEETGFVGYWNQDHGCFVGHTFAVGLVHETLRLPGVYLTNSRGTDKFTPNCWMYPLEGGGWRIYRFGLGTAEANTWETSLNGWTTCVVGVLATLAQVAARYGGIDNGKGFAFLTTEAAILAIAAFGRELRLPPWTGTRVTSISVGKNGLEVTFPFDKATDGDKEGGNCLPHCGEANRRCTSTES